MEQETTDKDIKTKEEQSICKDLLEYFEELDEGMKPLTLERKK